MDRDARIDREPLPRSGKMVTPTRKLFPSVTNRHIFPALTSHSILGSSKLRSCGAKRVSADESILQAMNPADSDNGKYQRACA
jgi:hypothetical protein